MNTLQRIILRIIRLKNESMKIGCIFLVFAILFLFISVVATSIVASTLSLPSQYQPYIKLQPKEGKENIWDMTDATAEQAFSVDCITGYNGLITVYAMLSDKELIPGKFSQSEDPRMKLTRLLGNNNSNQSEYFLSGDFYLLFGTNISDDMKGTALISSEVATMNSINLGDVIKIETSTDSIYGNPSSTLDSYFVTITGVFEVTSSSVDDFSNKAECDIEDNFIFIDVYTAMQILSSLHETNYDGYNSGILFFSTSPADLDQISEQLLMQLEISNDDVTIIINDGGYSKVVAPLLRMTRMLYLILTVITLAGGAIIALFYYASIRKRFREFAIYISIGMPKVKIILQVIIETLLFIIPAILVSTGVVVAVVNHVDISSVDIQLTAVNIFTLVGYMFTLLAIAIIITAIILNKNKTRDLFLFTV